MAKRGKLGAKKQVWRCDDDLIELVRPIESPGPDCPKCRKKTHPLLKPLIAKGRLVKTLPNADKIRQNVLDQLSKTISLAS